MLEKTFTYSSRIEPCLLNQHKHKYDFDIFSGYTKVFISKQLLTDITILKVYVDGNLTNYSYTATDSACIIIVHYTHSTHRIEIIVPEIPSHKLLLALITPATIALIHKKKRSLTKHL